METKITVATEVLLDRDSVWKLYTLPEHIVKWNFASPEWHCPVATNDLKVGGKYSTRMEAKDGSFGFDFEGTYDEISKPEKLVYSLEDGRVVTTGFQTTGSGTEIVITFDAEKENDIEMQKNGWQAILNNFKAFAESQ